MNFPRLVLVILAFSLALPMAARAGDLYTVADVPVSASAASASEAQTIAINAGRQQAWATLLHRLTRSQDWGHVPPLDDVGIQRLISTYQISGEARSTTRYVAKVTYVFNPDAVRRFLRGSSVAYADVQSRPVLILPMGQAYSAHSPWAAAWNDPRFAQGSVPLIAPSGDAAEGVTLASLQFGSATWNDLGPYADRVHAAQAVLAQALPARDHITVKLRVLAPNQSQNLADVNVAIAPGTPPDKAFGAAADAVAEAIANTWKSHSAVDFNARAKVTVDVRISSITDWGQVQQKLAAIPTVIDVNIIAMNIHQARVSITYAGTFDQLRDLLGQGGLQLVNQDGVWRLASAPAPATSASAQ